jgi:hypothetical protein
MTIDGHAYRGVSLQEYLPLTPVAGKLPPVSLLRAAAVAHPAAGLDSLIDVCVDELGQGETVWRVRSENGLPTGELYFWAHASIPSAAAFRKVAAGAGLTLAAEVDWDLLDALPLLCLSIDLPLSESGVIDQVSLYVEFLPATAGYYLLDRSGPQLLGTQTRYVIESEWSRFLDDIRRSPVLARADLDWVMPTALRSCEWVYLTHKPAAEGIYCTGLTIGQLQWFLNWTSFVPAVQDFVQYEADRLDQLRFDVGFNLVAGSDGTVPKPVSAGIYGVV